MTERVLTLRELNRALLARQLLLERRRLAVQAAVEKLCAIQAQWPQSPYIALWTRLTGFRKEQLTRALLARASAAGAQIRRHARVEHVTGGPGAWQVHTDSEVIGAAAVVVAAGRPAAARRLLPPGRGGQTWGRR